MTCWRSQAAVARLVDAFEPSVDLALGLVLVHALDNRPSTGRGKWAAGYSSNARVADWFLANPATGAAETLFEIALAWPQRNGCGERQIPPPWWANLPFAQ